MRTGKHAKSKYLARNIDKEFREQLTVGQRLADKVASFGGSWPFIFLFLLALFLWMSYQTILARNRGFDPYPYILLNLILSCLAALQAPLIMMSQHRQAQKDRLRSEHDFEINLKAETEIEHVQLELDSIRENQDAKMLKVLEEIRSLAAETKRKTNTV